MGGASFLLLSSLGLALTVQAQQCTRPVGSNMNLKDNFITLTEFPDGITVTLACSIGYETAGGSGKTTCANGSWSPWTLRCQRKSCGSAGELENGVIDYSEGIEFGDKATVTCNQGYDLVGQRELLCGDQGWMNRLPVCEVIKCDPPSKITNGTFGPVKESYAYDEAIKYTCIPDNALDGSSVLTCSDGGNFKPNPPKCTYVECSEPNVTKAQWKHGSRPPYRYKASVTYECLKGFRFQGHDTVMCGINSQWSPGPIVCIPEEKPKTTTTRTTTTTAEGETTDIPPDSGGDNSNKGRDIGLGVGIPLVLVLGGVVYYFGTKRSDKKQKRTQISHHDKTATDNGETELSPITNATDENDVKDDVAEQKNSIP